MKIGVLGASGLIGHQIAIEILLHQHELVIIHRAETNPNHIQDLNAERRIADLNDRGSLVRAFQGLDMVVHAAAYVPHLPKPLAQDLKISRLQMHHFIDALKKNRIPNSLFIASSAILEQKMGSRAMESDIMDEVYEGAPNYVQCKHLQYKMAIEANSEETSVTIAIPATCFGAYDYRRSTSQYLVDICKKRTASILQHSNNIIFGRDLGRGLYLALEKGKAGQSYLIGGVNSTNLEVAQAIADLSGIEPIKKVIKLPLALLLARWHETQYALFRKPPRLTKTMIHKLSEGQHLNLTKAKRELGFEAEFDLKETLELTLNWLKKEKYIE